MLDHLEPGGRSPARWWRAARALVYAVGCWAGFHAPVTGAAQEATDEYRLKAAFVLRFPQFVQWPASALGDGAFEFCVLSPDPFGSALRELVQGEQIGARPMAVRRVRADDETLQRCHVLYVPSAARRREALLRRLATQPVLTISDAPRFLDEGGIVQLRLVSNRVRFDVSTAVANRAGLRISAQLLQLALSVRGGPS